MITTPIPHDFRALAFASLALACQVEKRLAATTSPLNAQEKRL